MNLLEINAHLQSLENEKSLLRWKIDTWCAWPILRFNLASTIANLTIDSTDIQMNVSDRLRQSFHDFSGIFRTSHPLILIFVASTNRVEVENGLYKDIIFDDLLKHVPNHCKIEHINNKLFLNRSKMALYPSHLTTSGIYLVNSFFSKYLQPRSIIVIADDLFSTFRDAMGVSSISRAYIRRVLSIYYWRKIFFRALLLKIKPQILLLQVAYTNHAVVAAAKELGIKVIEFQHGIIDRHHPGYSWTNNSVVYKNQMPIPDRIFVYGDYWMNELSLNGFWKEEIRSVGSLHLDQFRSYLSLAHINRGDRSPNRIIVVTTQSLDVDNLISFLIEFINITKDPIELYIKLHPRESNRSPYEQAFKNFPNVHILAGHEPPSTFELISKADYHASIHSTCHYEALGLGKPTIILPFTNHERVLHLCNQAPGYALLARSPDEMCQIIARDRTVPAEIARYYFNNNVVDNMLDELSPYLNLNNIIL